MGGSRWFHQNTGETLPIDRKDLFKPDRSEILKKRGSVLFQLNFKFCLPIELAIERLRLFLAKYTKFLISIRNEINYSNLLG